VPSPQAISNALHGTAIEALWTGTSFLLASTVCQPNFLSLSDLFGRRELLLVALFFFTLGAILCGVSKNFTVMLVGRCIQGIGVGGVMALSETLIADLIPLRQRGNFIALLSIVWAIGTVAGKLVPSNISDAMIALTSQVPSLAEFLLRSTLGVGSSI
jgi:MFS family permease